MGSPGGFGGRTRTILSAIYRISFDFFVYQSPSVDLVFGPEGFDIDLGVVQVIGVIASVAREIVKREVRIDHKGEADEPTGIGLSVGKASGVGDVPFIWTTDQEAQRRRAAEMVGVLQPFADAGDIFGFWKAARKYGDPLADLALEFHRTLYGDSLSARVGVSKLELGKTGGDYRLSREDLGEIKGISRDWPDASTPGEHKSRH